MLKLSKMGNYGLKAVCYVAQQSPQLLHIKDISESQQISETCLRRIIADLNKSGILESVQGRKGGVKLARDPKTISVYDILESVGEELGITDCTRGDYCDKTHDCLTTNVMGSLQKGMNTLLKIHTLDKIIDK